MLDGFNLRYQEKTPVPYSARKAYLIYGWMASRHVFNDFILRLPADWQVRVLDLPRYGGASFTEPFDIAMITETFAAQTDAPVHILGWSLSGLVALYLVVLYSDGICPLCLIISPTRLIADMDYLEGPANPVLDEMVGAF